MLHLLLASWFWHPLAEGNGSTCSATVHSGCGYSFWSGGGSDIAEVTLVVAAVSFFAAWWRKHNCHVEKCWRLSWHPHPGHGHPVCRKHHPYGQGRGDHLKEHHHRDFSSWPSLVGQPFEAASHTMSFTGISNTGGVCAVVGEVTASEPPAKKQRVRKPGTPDVTDIETKKPSA